MTVPSINYNGQLTPAAAPVAGAGTRGLRYGDGLFETMRLAAGEIPFFTAHMARLFQGMEQLGFSIPDAFTPAYLQGCITELCRINDHLAAARVRLMVYRGNGGLFDTEEHTPNYIIESFERPLTSPQESPGLVTGIYTDARKAIDTFSHIKSNNYQPYLQAALHARKVGWQDALLLNTNGTVCESSIANVFIIKDGMLITPALSQGCIAGVMRKHLLSVLPVYGYEIAEDLLTLEMLADADEVFLTNAIQGIRPVAQAGDTVYQHTITTQIKHTLGY